jgi:hypothetical protein
LEAADRFTGALQRKQRRVGKGTQSVQKRSIQDRSFYGFKFFKSFGTTCNTGQRTGHTILLHIKKFTEEFTLSSIWRFH